VIILKRWHLKLCYEYLDDKRTPVTWEIVKMEIRSFTIRSSKIRLKSVKSMRKLYTGVVTAVKSMVYSFRSTRVTLDTVLFTIRKFVLP